jgi:CxxC motif-containing protein (DUF1111 family)
MLRPSVPSTVLVALLLAAGPASSNGRSPRRGGRAARSGPGPGEPLAGLTRHERALFHAGLEAFAEEDGLVDGLGPIFNDVSCAACHSTPAVGGGSTTNETRAARLDGDNYIELPGGSLFQSNALRPDCAEAVPADANVLAVRQTQPLFGLGLVEAIPDWQIEAYRQRQVRFSPGQAGRVNRVVDAPTGRLRVGRFGWKAQQATLLAFSGDAYLNEMGVTSPHFPRENAPNGDEVKLRACDAVADPEDDGEDVEAFANFMRFLAPPPRDAGPRGRRRGPSPGERSFEEIGCSVCHATVYRAASPIAAINGVRVEAFSDFLLHDVGTGDGIVQGNAGGSDFRTAPLWGLAESAPFLHDGSAFTVTDAIRRHRNQGADASRAFDALSLQEQSALLEFLDSI